MSVLSIVKPLPLTLGAATLSNAALLLTPDPKEAASKTNASGSGQYASFDLGAPTLIDTIIMGYANATIGGLMNGSIATAALSYSPTSANPLDGTAVQGAIMLAPSSGSASYPRHFVYTPTTPVTMRSFAVTVQGPPGVIGLVSAGLAFRPTWGHEYGSGRTIGDTGSASRNFAGGFSIDDGVATTGWQWTLGDLSDAEREALFQLVKDRRTTRSVLVIEDPDFTTGLHERIHWGLFDRLESYERDRPGNNRWSFRIEDWV